MRNIEIIKDELIGESIKRIKHKSGLTVLVCEKELTAFYALFATKYGSKDNVFDVDGQRVAVPNGIAHFLEHKLFETEDGRDSFELFSELGADANAYTGFERTAYLFSGTENFYETLEVLINMVRTPVFTKENVKKEQGIIAQEIKMCEDRPSDMRIYGLLSAMFGEGSPFSIPIAGTVQSIAEITPELLYKCYGAFYRMSNMVLAICGNVDADRIMDIVDRMIDDEPTERALTVAEPQPLTVFKPLVTARAQIAKPIFEIGIKHSAATLDDLAACSMLSAAVFGSCEDFYSGVFEEDLVSSYRFEYEYLGQGSYFSVQGDSFEPMKVLERFKETVNAVKRDGVSRDAFERAKRSVYSGEIMDLDDSESIAEGMMDGFVIGQSLIEGIDSVRNVTYEQVNALAKELFCEDRIAMSVVYPLENTGEVNEDEQ